MKVYLDHSNITQNMHGARRNYRYVLDISNYNMQGMTKTPSELFAMLKTAEVEIKKEHVVFMVNKTVEFKKSGKKEKGKKGIPKKGDKPVVTPRKAPKPGPKPGVECFYCKGYGH